MKHWLLSLHDKYLLTFSFPLVKYLQQTPSFLLFKWYGEVGGCSDEATFWLDRTERGTGRRQLVWWKRVACLDLLWSLVLGQYEI